MTESKRLSADAARAQLDALSERLTAAQDRRLRRLTELADEHGLINLGRALAALYPESQADASANFRQLRAALRTAAQQASLNFTLEVDNRRGDPAQRSCWFVGRDPLSRRLEPLAETTLDNLPRIDRAIGLEAAEPGKVTVYVGYAEADRRLATELIAKLRSALDAKAGYKFEVWDRSQLLASEPLNGRDVRRESAGIAVALLSVNYLADERAEIADLTGPSTSRKVLWALLQKTDLGPTVDTRGIPVAAVYAPLSRPYSHRTSRTEYVQELANQIYQLVTAPSQATTLPSPTVSKAASVQLAERLARRGGLDGHRLIGLDVAEGVVSEQWRTTSITVLAPRDRFSVLPRLEQWALDPAEPRLCALLGEYGTGKTITCAQLTRRLLDQRANDANRPLPVLLDLRDVPERLAQSTALTDIVQGIVDAAAAGDAVSAHDVLELVRTGEGLLIVDGLDEVLVRLSPADGKRFTRLFWNALPREGQTGKMLISCRSHYFRSLRDQIAHFSGEDRRRIRGTDHLALELQPLSMPQIQQYLQLNLPNRDVSAVLALLRSVHDLLDLAKRPYLLSKIAENLAVIEGAVAAGGTFNAARVYRTLTEDWLHRDDPKHTLTLSHKRSLMQTLAAAQWRRGDTSWSADDVEQLLVEKIANPAWSAHYLDESRQLLKEDLRTATFLVRQGEDRFRFAHTSLQEYFLAEHLAAAAITGDSDGWDLPVPSPETLHFLGQTLVNLDGPARRAALTTMRAIITAEPGRGSELVLAYVLHAHAHGYPATELSHARLDGRNLSNWRFAGTLTRQLDLSNASLTGALLRNTEWQHARLAVASLREADLTGAVFNDVDLGTANLDSVTLTATRLRDTGLSGANLSSVRTADTHFIRCYLPSAAEASHQPPRSYVVPGGCSIPKNAYVAALTGHSSGANAVAYSSSGARLASAGDDGTVRIWNAHTGEPIHTFTGHTGGATAVAYTSNGARLATANGGTVRIWNAHTGELIDTLTGHTGEVLAVAYSLDGAHFATAGDDSTVRIWNTLTGKPSHTLTGHTGEVRSVAYSPDGTRLATAGDDETVRIWNAHTGELIDTLTGHTDWVRSVAYSPDGTRLATAGDDSTVRIWNAHTGKPIHTLTGHTDWVRSVAYRPDGVHLATAADDGIRIWNAHTGEPIHTVTGHIGWVRSVAYSPDGAHFATVGDDSTVRIWNAHTGKPIHTLTGHTDWVLSVAYSPDGAHFATVGDDSTVRIWNAHTGKPIHTLTGHTDWVNAVAYSPDGTQLATAGTDGTLRIWNAHTGSPIHTLTGHTGGVNAVAYNPDGTQLASGGDREDGTVRIWNSQTGDLLDTLTSHTGGVNAVAYSPAGTQLASGGTDGAVRIWHTHTGDVIYTLTEHSDWVRSVAYSPNGSRLVTVGDDGTIRIWNAQTYVAIGFIAQLHNGELASWDPTAPRIFAASAEAWRWLRFLVPQPDAEPQFWPAESFGPLPPIDGP